MSRQPATLFVNSAIAAVETIRRYPAKIHDIPGAIAREVTDLIAFRDDWDVDGNWDRMKSKFTPIRLIYFARATNCNANDLSILMASEGNSELLDVCRQLGANNRDAVIKFAIKFKRSDVLEYCLRRWDEPDLAKALFAAINYDNFEAIESLSLRGTNFDILRDPRKARWVRRLLERVRNRESGT